MDTGQIEIEVEDILLLNRAEELPFSINSPEILVILIFFSFLLVFNYKLFTALTDTGATSRIMRYNLDIRLGLALKEGIGIILANSTNVEYFTTKQI